MTTVHYTPAGDPNGEPKTKLLRIVNYATQQHPVPLDQPLPTLAPNPNNTYPAYTFDGTWDHTDALFRASLLRFALGHSSTKWLAKGPKAPRLSGQPLNMYALYTLVRNMGGYAQ